jgi:hypothetical protein
LVREGVSGSVLEDPGNPQALAVALAEWLNRGCDRGELHASVSARAQKPWLEALEAIVVESAKAASAG